MVVQLGLLGAFKGEKLMKGKVIAVILAAGVDGDAFGNDVVGDSDHSFLADRTGDGVNNRIDVFRSDGVDILGGNLGDEVGD